MSDDLRELYQEVILDHGRHPRNLRHPPEANHQAYGNNPMCGDQLTVFLTLDGKGLIEDAAFEGHGCAISTASASLMTELVKGKTKAAAEALFDDFHAMCTQDDFIPSGNALVDEEALDRLQVMSGIRQYPMRVKCATLAWHTLHAALASKQPVKVSTE